MPAEPSRRRHRRVRRPGAPGADPTPQRGVEAVRAEEDTDHPSDARESGNDARLRRDIPPHWGRV